MVMRKAASSVSEDDGDMLNENGKRPSEASDKVEKKKIKTKSLYRQPTVRELNRLQETENLFNSNLFRLQVEEILQEVQVKEKVQKRFQEWLGLLKTHLLSIQEDNVEYDLSEPKLFKTLKVKLPLGEELKKTKCMFTFKKFNSIEVVGAYSLDCAINSKLIVDLQIVVPAEVYTKNDSINYRYHKKRAAYLAYIASHLKNLELLTDLSYAFINGDETKPVLDVTPSGKLSSHLSVRINLVCEAEAYKLHRFAPSRNNLREAWLFSLETQEGAESGPPTPIYNNSVLTDLTATENQQFLNESLKDCDNLKQAIVLLKIWLRQRQLEVSGHVISLYVAYLVQTKRVNNIMSSYQIVRNVWIALNSSEWDVKGISLNKGAESPTIEEFHQHFPVVFLDRTGCFNICWQMCKGTYMALKRECSLAVDLLDNGKINSFIPLFMTPMKPLAHFDYILRFRDVAKVKECVINKCSRGSRVSYGLCTWWLVRDALWATLARAAGRRALLLRPRLRADLVWPVTSTLHKAKKERYEENLWFGFIFDPEHFMDIVDKGPSANLPEAEEFRAFWGERSELRRFRDGDIAEAVAWDARDLRQRRAITQQIVEYLMQLKYEVPAGALYHVSRQLERLQLTRAAPGGPHGAEAALPALTGLQALSADLRGLAPHCPLAVAAVHGVSSVFSYCDPCPPRALGPVGRGRVGALGPVGRGRVGALGPVGRGRVGALGPVGRGRVGALGRRSGGTLPAYVPVARAVIELEHSGSWPGSLQAFRCARAAWHVQLAQLLSRRCGLPVAVSAEHFDVVKNGIVFRLQVVHPKEITLLRREHENGVLRHRERDDSRQALQLQLLQPRLRAALHGLQSRCGALGPAAVVLQRWASAHLLSPPAVPATVLQQLVAAALLSPGWSPPVCPLAAVARTLHLIADTDWERDTVVVDFNGDLSREERSSLEAGIRAAVGPGGLALGTSVDADAPGWAAAGVRPHALRRLRALARATLTGLENAVDKCQDNVMGLFVPSLEGYDALIRLRPELVPMCAERVWPPPPAAPAAPGPAAPGPPAPAGEPDCVPIVEFNVVDKYLQELRSAYGEWALFFHDRYGGDVIAVLWRPHVRDLVDTLQIGSANALEPLQTAGGPRYRVNTDAILHDWRVLGAGLVRDVVHCRD